MKAFLIGLGGLAVAFVVLVIGIIVFYFNTLNRESTLRNQFNNKIESNKNAYDNMWKTISQEAEIPSQYSADVQNLWKEVMAGQSSGARTAAVNVFVNRFNPKNDQKLYSKLMNVIESHRREFMRKQDELIAIKTEHDNMRTNRPAKWIVGDVPALVLNIVTSDKTSDAFESGKDNDVQLFKKDKK